MESKKDWGIVKKMIALLVFQIVILITLLIAALLLFPDIKPDTPFEVLVGTIIFLISLYLSFTTLSKKFVPEDINDFTYKYTLLYLVFGILTVIFDLINNKDNKHIIYHALIQAIYILSVYFFSKWFLTRKFKSRISNQA